MGAGRVVCAILAVAMIVGVSAPDAPAADTCANAAFRSGSGADLPECRAWERVTPADQNGENLGFENTAVISGDRALFAQNAGPSSGAAGAPFVPTNLSTRGPSWGSRGIDPPFSNVAPGVLAYSGTMDVSDDLRRAVVVTDRALAPGAIEGGANVYLEDLDDGSFRLVAAGAGSALRQELTALGRRVWGRTAGLQRFVFPASEPLTPDAGGGRNLYEWTGSSLRVASISPGGQPMDAGSSPPAREAGALSSDGRRVTFGAPAGGYQRLDGTSTVLFTRSHRDQTDQTAAAPADSLWPAADGTQVTFTSEGEPLTNESSAGYGRRLYRWNATGDQLVDLLADVAAPGASANVDPIQRVSSDGRYVWLRSRSALRPGDPADGGLYVLDTVQPLLTLVSLPFEPGQTGWDRKGDRAAFTEAGGGRVYSFDAAAPAAAAVCVTCGAPGSAGAAPARLGPQSPLLAQFEAYPVTDDGRVFFDTASPLLSADANTVSDVYEFQPGRGLSLLTPGSSGNPATFRQLSADGRDALFSTADPLVANDENDLIDLYDARAGGGLSTQQVGSATPFGCAGDACRGPSSAAPESPRPAPPASADSAPVTFVLAKPSASALRSAARSGRLAVRARASTAGKVALRARARIGRARRTVATASRSLSRRGSVTLTLSLSKTARTALRRDGRLGVAIAGRFSRASFDRSLSITLRRTSNTDRGGAR